MLAPGPTPEEGIGTLFSRLIDDGRDLVRAEIALYRELTLNRLLRSRKALMFGVAAALLAQASVTALLIGVLIALTRWMSPVVAGVAVAVLGLLVSGLLLRAAVRGFAEVAEPEEGKGNNS